MKTGVYRVRNTIDNKCYIGSAARSTLGRWAVHRTLLKQKKHHANHLQNAWYKHGADAFVFEVLLYCDPANCVMYEQIAIDHYKPEYNTAPKAGSSLGIIRARGDRSPWYGKKHSQSTKSKMSQAKVGKNHPNFGKKLSEATRARIGVRLAGENCGHAKLTTENVLAIRELLKSGNTQLQIAQQFNVSKSSIGRIARSESWRLV